jgi:hypothetical protein
MVHQKITDSRTNRTVRPLPLLVGGIAIFTASAGATATVLHFRPLAFGGALSVKSSDRTPPANQCKTIARDPNPPMNVRSSPVVAPDNIVGTLMNGTQLSVIDEKNFGNGEHWLRINAPHTGWVSKKLTVTSCVPVNTPQAVAPPDSSADLLAQATAQYHNGHLAKAIALAQSIPANSLSHDAAKAAIHRWQTDWKTAETTFNEAQRALNQGQWQSVITRVRDFPDNRFWRDKLALLVRKAMDQQRQAKTP